MPDTDEQATEPVFQADFTGEDQPGCMLDAEFLVAKDLCTTAPDIDVTNPVYNSIEFEDSLLGCDQNNDQEPATIFARWADQAPEAPEACSTPDTRDGVHESLEMVSYDARKHFDTQMQICSTKCSRHPLCILPNEEKLAISFEKRNLHERAQEVRAIPLATSAHWGEANFMSAESAESAARKRRRLQNNFNMRMGGRNIVVYSLFGRRMCRASFSAVVQLKPSTISRYAHNVTESEAFEPLVSKENLRQLGKKGIQRTLLCVFLSRYADDYGLESPTGVHSAEEMSARILPVGTTRQGVYQAYLLQWIFLCTSAISIRPYATKPDAALSYSAFRRYWNEDISHIRISKGGSDFCDLCTRLKDNLARLPPGDLQRMSDFELFKTHRAQAKVEFDLYKSQQRMWNFLPLEIQSAYSRQFVFDFAEKVLLPRLLEQPGQLHFITGLKFDINGVSSSRTKINRLWAAGRALA